MHWDARIYRNMVNRTKDAYRSNMIGVIVGNEDASDVSIIEADPLCLECFADATRGDTCINKQTALFVTEVIAVATATTGQTHEPNQNMLFLSFELSTMTIKCIKHS